MYIPPVNHVTVGPTPNIPNYLPALPALSRRAPLPTPLQSFTLTTVKQTHQRSALRTPVNLTQPWLIPPTSVLYNLPVPWPNFLVPSFNSLSQYSLSISIFFSCHGGGWVQMFRRRSGLGHRRSVPREGLFSVRWRHWIEGPLPLLDGRRNDRITVRFRLCWLIPDLCYCYSVTIYCSLLLLYVTFIDPLKRYVHLC